MSYRMVGFSEHAEEIMCSISDNLDRIATVLEEWAKVDIGLRNRRESRSEDYDGTEKTDYRENSTDLY